MKPKELFIGALVLHEDQLCIVEHIEKAGLIYCQICGTEKYRRVEADSLKPVPLTLEILEKFGFKNCQYWHELICGDAIIQAQIPHIRIRNGEKKYESDSVSSIHELQAALRLCGIEMEVEV